MLQLLEPCVGPKLKGFGRHVGALKQFQQLARARPHVPLTPEAGQQSMDFIEPDPVAAIVPVTLAKAQLAAGENIGDGFGNLPHLVICRCRARR